MKYDALVSGYVSMDHIIKVASPVRTGCTSIVTNADSDRICYGGCSVNIAVSLCRLGVKAMPLLRVGKDYECSGFKRFLEESHVPTEGVKVMENETTSTCYLIQDNHCDHITIYYPGSMDKKYAEPAPDSFFQNTSVGVITVASQPDNGYFLKKCKKYGVPVVFGMKDDFDAFPAEFLREVLLQSSIVFMNETERGIIEKLLGRDITSLFDIGKAHTIVTTLGKDGSVCYAKSTADGRKEYRIGICEVGNVLDATGAGDAYMAGFLYGHLKNRTVKECCCLGAALSSFILEGIGCCANVPDSKKLEERAEKLYERINE